MFINATPTGLAVTMDMPETALVVLPADAV
jgi:hypothetical protein